ncbi:MAG: DNA polymerase domain-containing protein [Candidatus Saliniplasma sp.]
MKGWILDIYPDLKKKMVIWIRTNDKTYKVFEEYDPVFYVEALDGDYEEVKEFYQDMGFGTAHVQKKTTIYDTVEKEVLKISPGYVFDPRKQAGAFHFFDGYENYQFYNVDIPLGQRYLIEKGVRPFSLVDKNNGWIELERDADINYSIPSLRKLSLSVKFETEGIPTMKDQISYITLGNQRIEGDEREIIEDLNRNIKVRDPDILLTSNGDHFLIPYLYHRARVNEKTLQLGREKSIHVKKQGSSHVSYGRVIYKPPSYHLKGRIHIDMQNSFLFREGGIDGLIEISRLSKIPLQKLARRSPGSAIDAMELEQVMTEGYLIPWKRNISERFKSAEQLLKADRGGHIFEPKTGIYFDVLKLDFASMYPSIIDKYNLSPETIGCDCGNHHEVPELGYKVCDRRRGLIPKVVSPLIQRRQKYKSMKGECFSKRADTLKWLLVTCFGYTGYKKARFSNIEVHESITAYGRDILIEAADIAQKMGYRLIHGIVDSLWLKGDQIRLDELIVKVKNETDILLENEGTYRWIVFLSSKVDGLGVANRYYGVLNDELEMRGIHARRKDTPMFFKGLQKKVLKMLKPAQSREGLKEKVDEILNRVKKEFVRLKNEEVDFKELYFTKTVSKKAEEYSTLIGTKAALLQYDDMDISIHPGEQVRYIITNQKSRDHREKVTIEGKEVEHYDREFYVKYFYRVVEEILAPFGYDEKKLKRELKRV